MSLSDRYYYQEGVLYNNKTFNNRAKKGQPAGCLNKEGYICLTMDNRYEYAHRIIYCLCNDLSLNDIEGKFIDHKDNDRGK